MKLLKVQLGKNLRRNLLRGHPWVYREALKSPLKGDRAQLCQVSDHRNDFLGWAIYDPHNPLALRMLSTERKFSLDVDFEKRYEAACSLRQEILPPETNCYRLFNGEGDQLPGMVCDVYNEVAVLQFDGVGPSEFWDKESVAKWLLQQKGIKTVVEKKRSKTGEGLKIVAGELESEEVVVKENGVLFLVNLEKGQKTGFFLDQRDNREYVKTLSRKKRVLNLFSYSGGFSMYAGRGRASEVVSLDISEGALKLAEKNWELNELPPGQHRVICTDVFEYLKAEQIPWDCVIVDPPSMSHSEKQREKAMEKYIEIFTAATNRVRSGGDLCLSSCSSHVSFNDFFEVINQALSKSRRQGQILKVSGQGMDHPFPHICHELRYLKFVHLRLS